MKNVLFISERWWPEGSGGILASYLIANILRKVGFELTVIHGTKQPKVVEDINYVYTEYLKPRNKHEIWLNCLLLTKESWFLDLMRKSDIVYIPRLCYPLIPFAKKLGKRIIVHLHDYQPVSYNSVVFNGRNINRFSHYSNAVKFEILERNSVLKALAASTALINMLCRLWLKEADIIICVSQRQAEIISNKVPELAHKIRVVYNPLPKIAPIKKDIKNSAFLYLGGDSYIKGFYVLLEASLKLLKRGLETEFILAGSYRDSSRQIIDRLGKHFNLLGYISHEEVMKIHSHTFALLFPSICEEPLPYAVLEAMLANTMPIASRVGGVPEIVEGTYAEKMMFMSGCPDEMADRMEEVLSLSRDTLDDIGHKLRESVMKKFDDEAVKQRLLRIFEV